MPELPEAETIVRDLQKSIAGARVQGAQVIWKDVLAPGVTATGLNRALRGRRISDVVRRGKNVVLVLDAGHRLVINLGMTGRVVPSDAARAADLRHIAVRFPLEDGRTLYYDDARRFGSLDLLDARQWAERDAQLGIEPLSDAFTPQALHALTRASITPIRNWLLDQRRVAGIGNIYANEALFRAGIRPTRRARTLTRSNVATLRDTLREVLQEAIAARGTTLNDYRDGSGAEGGYEPRLKVYGRAGDPCPVCATRVKRVVIGNRSAFYCPNCQR